MYLLLLFSVVEKSPISALAIAWLKMSKFEESIDVVVALAVAKFESLAEEPFASNTIHEEESPGTEITKMNRKVNQ